LRERWCVQHRVLLEELMTSVRTGDRGIFFEACRELAARWRDHGCQPEEICASLEALRDACLTALRGERNDGDWAGALHDHVSMTFQFGEDGVQEEFERDAPPES
jgi:hypothetical protein